MTTGPTYASAIVCHLDVGRYGVLAAHWKAADKDVVGEVQDSGPAGWTATAYRKPGQPGHPIGLYPDVRAAAESLVTYYGYALLPPGTA